MSRKRIRECLDELNQLRQEREVIDSKILMLNIEFNEIIQSSLSSNIAFTPVVEEEEWSGLASEIVKELQRNPTVVYNRELLQQRLVYRFPRHQVSITSSTQGTLSTIFRSGAIERVKHGFYRWKSQK